MTSLDPVPEDSVVTRITSKSEPFLPLPPPSRRGSGSSCRSPRAPRPGYSTPPGGYVTPPNGLAPPPANARPLSFPPSLMVTQDLIYDGNGSKESILYPSSRHSAVGEVYGPPRDPERGAETITVASSFGAIDDEELPLYRRPWVIACYIGIVFIFIAMAAALGVIFS